jgi:hypothetical protein
LDSYRFVVAVRKEPSSARAALKTWRGWVEQVYASAGPETSARRWFQSIDEVSPLIEGMVEAGESGHEPVD